MGFRESSKTERVPCNLGVTGAIERRVCSEGHIGLCHADVGKV